MDAQRGAAGGAERVGAAGRRAARRAGPRELRVLAGEQAFHLRDSMSTRCSSAALRASTLISVPHVQGTGAAAGGAVATGSAWPPDRRSARGGSLDVVLSEVVQVERPHQLGDLA